MVSDAMQATVVVAVIERVRHPRYGKTVQRTKRLYVHDAENDGQGGRPGPCDRDPPAVQAQALAPGRSPGACPMIQQESRLRVADNSGAKEVLCIKVLGGSRRRYASHRRHLRGHGQRRHPGRGGEEGRRREVRGRADEEGEAPPRRQLHPLRRERRGADQRPAAAAGTRIFGPVGRELRDKRFMRIVSLAPEVL